MTEQDIRDEIRYMSIPVSEFEAMMAALRGVGQAMLDDRSLQAHGGIGYVTTQEWQAAFNDPNAKHPTPAGVLIPSEPLYLIQEFFKERGGLKKSPELADGH